MSEPLSRPEPPRRIHRRVLGWCAVTHRPAEKAAAAFAVPFATRRRRAYSTVSASWQPRQRRIPRSSRGTLPEAPAPTGPSPQRHGQKGPLSRRRSRVRVPSLPSLEVPGPRSRCARVHARPCQGCKPCLRTIAGSLLAGIPAYLRLAPKRQDRPGPSDARPGLQRRR